MTLGIRKPTQKDLALDLSNFSFPLTYLMLGQALVCLLLNNHENRYYLCHRTGSQGFNRQTFPLEGVEGILGILTELKTISVLMFEVDHSQLHRVSLDILVDDQHICRKVHDVLLPVSAL